MNGKSKHADFDVINDNIVMYVSPDASFVLPVDNSGVLGSWG